MLKTLLLLLTGIFTLTFGRAQISGLLSGFPALKADIVSMPSGPEKMNSLLKTADHYLFAADIIGQADSAEICLREAAQLNQQFHQESVTNHIRLLRNFAKGDTTTDAAFYRSYLPIVAQCQQQHDKPNERLAWELMADAVHDTGMDSLKTAYYLHAQLLAHQLGDTEQELEARISVVHVKLDALHDVPAIIDTLHQLIAESQRYSGALNYCYYLMASAFFPQGKMDSALIYALRSEKIQRATGDTTFITNTYSTLSNIYYVMKDFDQGIYWSKKALQHCIWTGKHNIVLPVLGSITANLLQQGKAAEALEYTNSEIKKIVLTSVNDKRILQKTYGKIYLALKNYEEAEKHYRLTIRYGTAQGAQYPPEAKGTDYRALGLIYIQKKQYREARNYLDTALAIIETTSRQDFLVHIYQDLCVADSALGDYAAALRHLRASNQLSAIIYNQERDKKIEELSYQYKTEEKEKDFKLLQKEQLMARQQLMQTRVIRNWTFAGTLLLLAIVLLLYRQSRTRRRTNITISEKNALLEKLLGEKEWLLKEVHHRVKNNLHTIVSLLESQAAYLDADALQAVEKSQHRIYAMSLVHQKLYRENNLRTIDMNLYLRELLLYLSESFGAPSHIHIIPETEAIQLDVASAIAVGMITNEAVTNAFKYAFPGDKRGEIAVRLCRKEANIVLIITDNGIGMQLPEKGAEADSLGMELMKGFARDLEGQLQFNSSGGTGITVTFAAPETPE